VYLYPPSPTPSHPGTAALLKLKVKKEMERKPPKKNQSMKIKNIDRLAK
jgi:hypothetical protein